MVKAELLQKDLKLVTRAARPFQWTYTAFTTRAYPRYMFRKQENINLNITWLITFACLI